VARILRISLLCCALMTVRAVPQMPPSAVDESLLKAIMLERFTRFVQWPEGSPGADSTQPFVVAVLQDSEFESTVRSAYRTARMRNRQVRVVRAYGDSIPPCAMLYVGAAAAPDLLPILERLNGRPVLAVSHRRGFARRGVHINFFVNDQDQLRFEVNTMALAACGLKVSHLLLGVAKVIDPSRPEQP